MKVNFSAVLKDIKGEVINRPTQVADAEPTPITLGYCAAEALLQPDQDDSGTAKKIELYKLAMRVFEGGEQEITPAEATLLQTKIAKGYPSPLISGQCCELLNG